MTIEQQDAPNAYQLPISESAVVQRLNRKLAHTLGRVKVNRWHSRAQRELGSYMVVNSCNVLEWHTDKLTDIANEYDVLADNEIIKED